MPKKSKIHPAELDIFLEAMKGVKPLVQKKIRITKRPPTSKKSRSETNHPRDLALDDSLALDPVRADEFISYKQASISNKALRKLRKGQYNVQAILDLHGMTVAKAEIAVAAFLQECLHEGIRVALIIHGKGQHQPMPILKNKLNHWLRRVETILAFCSAAPGHGSRGALYILLKRANIEEKFD